MSQQPLATVGPQGNCRYCGAPLSSGYYFCTVCAAPHSNVEVYLPKHVPPYISDGTLVKVRAPHVAPLFWTYFGAVMAILVAGLLLFHEETLLSMVVSSAVIGVITIVFATLHWPSLAVQFKKLGFNRWEAWAGLGALAPLLAINYGYQQFLVRVIGIQEPEPNKLPLAVMAVFMAVVPAITEEIALRGLVQHWLQVAIRPMRAVIVASALFMSLHLWALFNPIVFVFAVPYLFCAGFVMGWTKLKTGSLYPSMLIHFVHNFVVVAFF